LTVHLILFDTRLRPAPGRLENTPCLPLGGVEEFAITQRTADGLGAVEPFDHAGIGFFGQEIREIRIALTDGATHARGRPGLR
jgi:hypothetical protein